MMDWVSITLRRLVIARAGGRCEYCLFPQAAAWLAFEMEHIIVNELQGLRDQINEMRAALSEKRGNA